MQFTAILRHQNTDHTYHCQNRLEAEVLFNALQTTGGRVELWEGLQLLSFYDPTFK